MKAKINNNAHQYNFQNMVTMDTILQQQKTNPSVGSIVLYQLEQPSLCLFLGACNQQGQGIESWVSN